MLSINEKQEIAKKLKAIWAENTCYYRDDQGNGSAGPVRITIDNKEDYQAQLLSFISNEVDATIIDHDFITNDGQTVKEMLQKAINDLGDNSVVTDDDIIVMVSDDNGWTGFFWLYNI